MTPREIRALARRREIEVRGSARYTDSYFDLALIPWLVGPLTDWVAEAILKHAPTAQAVAFRGMSGAMVAPIVASKLGLCPLGVRKQCDGSHGAQTLWPRTLEGAPVARYVIVDDFICSGATVREIRRECEQHRGLEPCLAVIAYARAYDQGHTPCGVRVYGGLPAAWTDYTLDPPRKPVERSVGSEVFT